MTEWKDGQELITGPIEPGSDGVLIRFGHLPDKSRPWDAMTRQTLLIKVEERR